jgi:hypothetical protein
MSYNIGETVWFDGTKWEIADGLFNGGYALWRKDKDGKVIEEYGWKNNEPDPLCPFFEGWVSPIYLGKVLTKERRQ